ANWARPAEVKCDCDLCKRLNVFLADPTLETGRIAAREDLRHHLTHHIQRFGCDVSHSLERKSSPFALVLTKTMGSFERVTKRFEVDCKLLQTLDKVCDGIDVEVPSVAAATKNAAALRP